MLLRLVLNEKSLKGVRASRRGPQISHLLFTDDSIVFAEASIVGANNVRNILC